MTSVDLMYMPPRSEGSSPSRARTDVDIGDVFQAVVSRWRLLLVCLALTLSCAALYIVLTPARYAATMSVLVDTRERPPLAADATPAAQNPESPLVENQMRLLKSNAVLRQVVDDERGLSAADDFGGTGAETPSIERLTEELAKSITIKRSDKSNVIDIETRAATPEKAEHVAQALVKAFLATQAQFSAGVADKENKWLDAKIEELRNRSELAEKRVQDYREAQSLVVTDGLIPSEQQIKNADAALVGARGRRADAEAKYAQLLAAMQSGSLEAPKETIRSPLLEKLLADYASMAHDFASVQTTLGPRHPAYVAMQSQLATQRALINREMQNVLDTQRRSVIAAKKVESDAAALVGELAKTINGMGGKRLELAELERQAAALRDKYAKALSARENTHADVVSSPNPLLITPPIAQSVRVSPKTLPALLIAVAGGVNLWIVAALLLEFQARKKPEIPAPAGPWQKAPAVGTRAPDAGRRRAEPRPDDAALDAKPDDSVIIPLPAFNRSESQPEDDEGVFARVINEMETSGEPYRRAIARLYERLPRRSPQFFLAVTSEREKAGGSTLTFALALFACECGDRVLVIDGNAKHATLASLLPYLVPPKQIQSGTLPMSVCRRDSESGGEIMLSRFNGGIAMPDRRVLARQFDLVLLDAGPAGSLPDALDAELDGTIALDWPQGAGQRGARLTWRSRPLQ